MLTQPLKWIRSLFLKDVDKGKMGKAKMDGYMKDPIQRYSLSEGLAKVMLVMVLQQSPSERHFMCEGP